MTKQEAEAIGWKINGKDKNFTAEKGVIVFMGSSLELVLAMIGAAPK